MYAAILFDLDGTLVNSIDLYGEAVREMFGKVGIPLPKAVFRKSYAAGIKLKDWLAKHGLGEEHVALMRPVRDARYVELLRSGVEWIDGARDLLASLEGRYPLGLITGSWQSYVDAIDARLSVTPHFQTVVTAEDMGDFGKPHPHSLLLAADRLGVKPEKCIYIGDQLFDVEAAKRAGMASCCVRGTYTPDGAMEEADFACATLRDAGKILSLY